MNTGYEQIYCSFTGSELILVHRWCIVSISFTYMRYFSSLPVRCKTIPIMRLIVQVIIFQWSHQVINNYIGVVNSILQACPEIKRLERLISGHAGYCYSSLQDYWKNYLWYLYKIIHEIHGLGRCNVLFCIVVHLKLGLGHLSLAVTIFKTHYFFLKIVSVLGFFSQ